MGDDPEFFQVYEGEVSIKMVNWLLKNSGNEQDLSEVPSDYSEPYLGKAEIFQNREEEKFKYDVEVFNRETGTPLYKGSGSLDSDTDLEGSPLVVS